MNDEWHIVAHVCQASLCYPSRLLNRAVWPARLVSGPAFSLLLVDTVNDSIPRFYILSVVVAIYNIASIVSYPDPLHSSGCITSPLRGIRLLLPRSGDVIHSLLCSGSGYETTQSARDKHSSAVTLVIIGGLLFLSVDCRVKQNIYMWDNEACIEWVKFFSRELSKKF